MKASFSARRAAALSCAAMVFAGALPVPAKAEPGSGDCAMMGQFTKEMLSALDGLYSVEDLRQMNASRSEGKNASHLYGVGFRMFGKDPKTGEIRLVGFLNHLRRAKEIANDISGKLEDPEAADVVDKAAASLDKEIAFFNKALVLYEQHSDEPDGRDTDETEDSGNSNSLSPDTQELQSDDDDFDDDDDGKAFDDGIDAYGGYIDKHCASAGGSESTRDTKH